MLTRFRDPFNAVSHYLGAAAAAVGLISLLAGRAYPPASKAALLVYGTSLVLMFLASAVYHTVRTTPRGSLILRKIDHSAIYLLIAGTYTPFCVMAFSGFWKWGMLAVIWSLAGIGILVKIFIIRAPRWVTAGVYVLMGWLSFFGVGEILSALPAQVSTWLLVGGLEYTAGAVVYITRRMDFVPGVFGFHEVWHLFVILGAAAHFIAVSGIAAAG